MLSPASCTYDGLGRLLTAVDPDGIATELYWSSTGELLRIESPDFGWRLFGYNADGVLTDVEDR